MLCWRDLDGLPFHIGRDKRPVKSLVVGRPILLALEDIDGGPSFLEKALRFLEKYGMLLFRCPATLLFAISFPRTMQLFYCQN